MLMLTTTATKLLGEYLREISPLTSEQIIEGLREQVIAHDRGERRQLGEILIARGLVAPTQVQTALERQRLEHGS